jgi:hypothetical protein
VLAASIIRAMMTEAASTSETSVNSYQKSQRNNPEDSHLHITLCLLIVNIHCLKYVLLNNTIFHAIVIENLENNFLVQSV